MRIARVETYTLCSLLVRPFGWSQGWIDHRTVGLVKITTDEGIVGWGEGASGPTAAVVQEVFCPFLLVGQDPTSRNGLWQRMFQGLYNGNVAGGFGEAPLAPLTSRCGTSLANPSGCPCLTCLEGEYGKRWPCTRRVSITLKVSSPPGFSTKRQATLRQGSKA